MPNVRSRRTDTARLATYSLRLSELTTRVLRLDGAQ
jgi:hypothetical protein